MLREFPRQVSRLFVIRSPRRRGSARRARRCPEFWALEGLEPRVLLSGSPTNYTVNLTSDAGASSGTDVTTGDPSGDLLWAIEQANANTNTAGSVIGFDTTVFAAAQTIALTGTLELSETAGPEVIDGAGAGVVTVSGGNTVGVFFVETGVTATISSLTISGGSVAFGGGGVFIAAGGTLAVTDSVITDNSAAELGGGIYDNGALTITDDSVISDNSAAEGGGVYGSNGVAISVTNSTVSSNKATEGGGGIAVAVGALTLTGSSVLDNSTAGGGGILTDTTNDVLTISDSTISGNTAGGQDGGIECAGTIAITKSVISQNSGGFGGGIGNLGVLTVDDSTIADNTGVTGGGIANARTLTITDGSVISGNTGGNAGGGIWNIGTLTVMDSTIGGTTTGDGNSAGQGGGIWDGQFSGTITVEDSTIAGNIGVTAGGAAGEGGGIFSTSPLTVTDTTFSGNSAYFGGAVSNIGQATITSSGFELNSATDGGAIANGGTLAVSKSAFEQNSASGDGGAIYNSSGSASIANCTISSNQGAIGGGIMVNVGTLTLTSSTLSGNTASDYGGGIYNRTAITVTNSTIADNSASLEGGGIVADGPATIVNTTIPYNDLSAGGVGGGIENFAGVNTTPDNTIVVLNTIGTGALATVDDIAGSAVSPSSAYNLVGADLTGSLTSTVASGNQLGVTDPGLGTLATNGGPTQTIALLAGSPAIDAGSNALALDVHGNPLLNDQRGTGFPRIVNGTVDIGAFEAGTTTVVSPQLSVNPVNLTYVTALDNSQLSGTATATVGGNVVNVLGSFSYTTAAGTVLGAGDNQSEAVTFTPTDSADYSTVTTTVIVNVAQATPSVSADPVNMIYGLPLDAVLLSGTATWTVGGNLVSVIGLLSFTSAPETVLSAGSQAEQLTFTPIDSTDYQSTNIFVTVNVAQASPAVSVSPVDLAAGTALDNSQLSGSAFWTVAGVQVSVGGTFAYTTAAGTVPSPGVTSELVTFTPADSIDYSAVTGNVPVTVQVPASITLTSQTGDVYIVSPTSGNAGLNVTLGGVLILTTPAGELLQFAGSGGTVIIDGENAGTDVFSIADSSVQFLADDDLSGTTISFTGNSISRDVVAEGDNNTFDIGGTGTGAPYDLVAVSEINSFVFAGSSALLGSITGADGSSALSYSAYSSAVLVNLGNGTNGTATGVSGTVTGITAVIGSSFNDTLIAGTVGNVALSGGPGVNRLEGGAAGDMVVESAASSFTLSDKLLTGTGFTDNLSSIETADLTETAGGNTFTVSGWTGSGSLSAPVGHPDTVTASKNASFTLTNVLLSSTDGMSLVLSGITTANLGATSGGKTFDVGGWTGNGSLTANGSPIVGAGAGRPATGLVVASKSADFTLTNASLSSSDGMSLVLRGITTADLGAISGDRTFTVSGWTGSGSLTASGSPIVGGGADRSAIGSVIAIKNAGFSLTNTALTSTDGMKLSLNGITSASLADSGAGGNTFTVSGWTFAGSLTGSTGSTDTVVASKAASYALSDESLTSTDGMSLGLSGVPVADLVATAANSTFDVSGWTGGGMLTASGTVIAGAGTDRSTGVVDASKNAGFTLTDTSLTSTDGMVIGLKGIATANLADAGPGGNTFTVSDWTGSGSLTGISDAVTASESSDVTLSNSELTAGHMSLALSGITTANLIVTATTGHPSYILDASAFSAGPVNLTASGTANAIIFGGTGGHDALTVAAADSGNNILIGNGAFDTLTDNSGGRDILIGAGSGDDTITGNGNDVLISGSTIYDSDTAANITALDAILGEWDSTQSYAMRISRIMNGVGPDHYAFNASTMTPDTNANTLSNGTSQPASADWFIVSSQDTASENPDETEIII